MRATPVAVALLTAALASPALGAVLLVGASTTQPATPSTPTYVVHPSPLALGAGAGEPSLGVNWNTGRAMVMAGTHALRVTFDDATSPPTAAWEDVTPVTSQTNVDPILFTNRVSGRTYAGGLDGTCSILSMTDDDGDAWVPVGNACVPTLDHPSISSGPWREPRPAQARSPHATYYCAQAEAVTCAISYDGGVTFSVTTAVTCGTNPIGPTPTPGLHGTVHVGDNGVVWIPFRRCGNDLGPLQWTLPTPVGVAVSMSNGQTWVGRSIPGSTSHPDAFDPDVATTPSGWAYVAWSGADNGPHVALTKTNGSTWTTPVNVGQSAGIRNVAFVEAVAGDDDRVAVAFIGSTTPGNGFDRAFTGVWHLYVATSTDAGATWDVVQVTQDPVQRGWICADGIGCPNGGTLGRNLLDFIDAQVEPDGRVLVAIADGCIGACASPAGTAAQSTSSLATLARQVCGPSLFAAVGAVEGASPCPGGGVVGPDSSLLDGTLYLRGLMPVGNAEAFISTSAGMLGGNRPTLPVPKVADAAPGVGGTRAPTQYDASFHGNFPGQRVDGPVTARLWVTAEDALGGTMTVGLYDASFYESAPIGSPLVNATIPLPTAPGLQEVVVTLPAVNATLSHGLTLVVSVRGVGDVQIYYDSPLAPSRLDLE